MENTVNITVNGTPLSVPENTTILDAAGMLNVHIPTLCRHPDLLLIAPGREGIAAVVGRNDVKAHSRRWVDR